jgi:hypothetical protein
MRRGSVIIIKHAYKPPRLPQDIQAHRSGEMAVFTSDTLEHDMGRISTLHQKQEQVAVFNRCADTTRNMNGVVTNMHPAEGVWLFRCVLLLVCLAC